MTDDLKTDLDRAAELVGLDRDDLPVHGIAIVAFLQPDGEMMRQFHVLGQPLLEQTVGLIESAKLDLVFEEKLDHLDLDDDDEDEGRGF